LRDRAVRPLLLLLSLMSLPPAFATGAEALIIPYVAYRGYIPYVAYQGYPAGTGGVLLACVPAGMLVTHLAVGRVVRPHGNAWSRRVGAARSRGVRAGRPLTTLRLGDRVPDRLGRCLDVHPVPGSSSCPAQRLSSSVLQFVLEVGERCDLTIGVSIQRS
jgi:hypothetical protein